MEENCYLFEHKKWCLCIHQSLSSTQQFLQLGTNVLNFTKINKDDKVIFKDLYYNLCHIFYTDITKHGIYII